MRKCVNAEHLEGYVYQHSLTVKQVKNEQSKNFGQDFISGDLEIAVDEEALNVITVHFTYVTATTSQGKQNATYAVLEKLIAEPDKTWVAGGKDVAFKVKVDTALALNDFIANDGSQVSAKRNEGGFVSFVTELCPENERNTFQMDMLINKVRYIEANPEKHIEEDYCTVGGIVFNFRNEILPVEFVIRNKGGMEYFMDMDASDANPTFTKLWGRINRKTIKREYREDSAWGEAQVRTAETKSREWLVTGTAKVPYEYGDEKVLTAEEVMKGSQDREIHWAEIKKRSDEYKASQALAKGGAMNFADNKPAPAAPAKTASFTF